MDIIYVLFVIFVLHIYKLFYGINNTVILYIATIMKNNIIITFLSVSFILFFSCKENVQKSAIGFDGVKNITLSSIEESFQDTSYFKNPQIVVLETLEESLLSEISRVFMDDSILFIYDRSIGSIFMFDITGKYINKIDCKGEGPGEYVENNDFTIDVVKKQIILLCTIPEKRMYFTYDGVLVKEERHPDFYSQITTDHNYLYFEKTVLGTNDYQLCILDTKTGEKEERLEPLGIKNSFYVNGHSLNRGKDVLFVRRYDNSIYELTNGEIINKYHVDFKKHSFPDWLIKEEETEVIMNECSTHEYIFSMSNVINNDNYMMFYTNMGTFVYDKNNDALIGYKQILNSILSLFGYSFTYYLPLENTNKIVFSIEDPSFIKRSADKIAEYPDNMKIKEMNSKHPELIKEIITIGGKMTEDNNPVLFIYEFKD